MSQNQVSGTGVMSCCSAVQKLSESTGTCSATGALAMPLNNLQDNFSRNDNIAQVSLAKSWENAEIGTCFQPENQTKFQSLDYHLQTFLIESSSMRSRGARISTKWRPKEGGRGKGRHQTYAFELTPVFILPIELLQFSAGGWMVGWMDAVGPSKWVAQMISARLHHQGSASLIITHRPLLTRLTWTEVRAPNPTPSLSPNPIWDSSFTQYPCHWILSQWSKIVNSHS